MGLFRVTLKLKNSAIVISTVIIHGIYKIIYIDSIRSTSISINFKHYIEHHTSNLVDMLNAKVNMVPVLETWWGDSITLLSAIYRSLSSSFTSNYVSTINLALPAQNVTYTKLN